MLEQLGCEAKFYRRDAKRQLYKEFKLMKGIHQLQPVNYLTVMRTLVPLVPLAVPRIQALEH